jgi:hypothetical protein
MLEGTRTDLVTLNIDQKQMGVVVVDSGATRFYRLPLAHLLADGNPGATGVQPVCKRFN